MIPTPRGDAQLQAQSLPADINITSIGRREKG